jgi:hypothetical protein
MPRSVRKLKPTSSPTGLCLTAQAKAYVAIGFCGSCVLPIEALQPGGLNCRHINDQSPLCSERTKLNPEETRNVV